MPPAVTGNVDRILARSYMTTSLADQEMYFGRRFSGGLRFRTLCAECNNGLGGKEDKAIGSFFTEVRKLLESSLLLTPIVKVSVKPNLIYKGLLAHLVSANDNGVPTQFDKIARDIYFGRSPPSLNLFFWVHLGPSVFLMREAFLAQFSPVVTVEPVQVLKFYPLGFMFTSMKWFCGLPNIRMYLSAKDDEQVDVPVNLMLWENHPVWPILPKDNGAVFLGGNSFGLVGSKD